MTVPNANWTTVSGSDADCASDSSRSSAASARPPIASRIASLITTVHPGEGWRAFQFFGYAFLLLVSYYTLKTIREPLLLAGGSAELKSYAYATIASVFCVMVPFYGVLFRRSDARQLTRRITVLCIATLGSSISRSGRRRHRIRLLRLGRRVWSDDHCAVLGARRS